jgi:hypothetical protein
LVQRTSKLLQGSIAQSLGRVLEELALKDFNPLEIVVYIDTIHPLVVRSVADGVLSVGLL